MFSFIQTSTNKIGSLSVRDPMQYQKCVLNSAYIITLKKPEFWVQNIGLDFNPVLNMYIYVKKTGLKSNVAGLNSEFNFTPDRRFGVNYCNYFNIFFWNYPVE